MTSIARRHDEKKRKENTSSRVREDQKTEGTKRKDKEKNLETRERERRPRQRRKAMLRHGAFSIEMT